MQCILEKLKKEELDEVLEWNQWGWISWGFGFQSSLKYLRCLEQATKYQEVCTKFFPDSWFLSYLSVDVAIAEMKSDSCTSEARKGCCLATEWSSIWDYRFSVLGSRGGFSISRSIQSQNFTTLSGTIPASGCNAESRHAQKGDLEVGQKDYEAWSFFCQEKGKDCVTIVIWA